MLCYSEGREQKERAINTLQERRFLDDFHRLQQSVAKGNIRRVEKVAERVGRLEERYPAVARRYDITANTDDSGKKTQNLTIVKQPIEEERATINGCYVIETSHKEMTAVDIWRCYMTLTHVERAFRSLKTDLGMRPVYHQVARRTKSHLFVSVLAYHLFVSIEHSLRLHGDHRRWLRFGNSYQLISGARLCLLMRTIKSITSGSPGCRRKSTGKSTGCSV